jgi:hypothetical protein
MKTMKQDFRERWNKACNDREDIESAQEELLKRYAATSFYYDYILPFLELERKSYLLEFETIKYN